MGGLTRRELIGSAALGVLAGCSGQLPGGGGVLGAGERPGFRSWVPDVSSRSVRNAEYMIVAVDLAALSAWDDVLEPTDAESTTEAGTDGDVTGGDVREGGRTVTDARSASLRDPMIRNPIGGLIGALLVTSVSLQGAGIAESVIGRAGGSFGSSTNLVFVNLGFALEGDYDAGRLADGLEGAGYERAQTVADTDVYLDGRNGQAVGISDGHVVGSAGEHGDPVDRVRTLVETRAGTGTPYHAASDVFDWLTGAVGDRAIVVGRGAVEGTVDIDERGTNSELFPTVPSVYEGTRGAFHGLEPAENLETWTATAALQYPKSDAAATGVDDLRNRIEDTRQRRLIHRGKRVYAEATYPRATVTDVASFDGR